MHTGYQYWRKGGKRGRSALSVKARGKESFRTSISGTKRIRKTSVLEPGRRERLKFLIPWREFAVYDEKNAIWVIESGNYILRLGRSSRDNIPIGIVCAEEKIVMEQCLNRLELAKCNQGKIKFLTKKTYKADTKTVSKKMRKKRQKYSLTLSIFSQRIYVKEK